MDLEKYKEEIYKTGFCLEFKMSEALRKDGWTVISNRYYVDDLKDTVREIDIVGYKTDKVQDITLYTAIIISCKKSDSNIWALLTKDIDKKNPNAEWKPMHIWTNHKVINYLIKKTEWKEDYFNAVNKYDVNKAMKEPEHDIFALQEMGKKNGKVRNDSTIFRSIESLMKAQAYEIKSLPNRKKEKVIYQFNLISIIDSELIRLKFEDDRIEQEEIDQDIYITNYIINNVPICVKIHFINASIIGDVLINYSQLHKGNCDFFEVLYNNFYNNIFEDKEKKELLKDDFINEMKNIINYKLNINNYEECEMEHLYLWWSHGEKILEINLEASGEAIKFLNDTKYIKTKTKDVLWRTYRYRSDFKYKVYDIPF